MINKINSFCSTEYLNNLWNYWRAILLYQICLDFELYGFMSLLYERQSRLSPDLKAEL